MSQSKTVFKNASALYALYFASLVFPAITFPYLVRVLGISIFGVLAHAISVIQIAVMFTKFSFDYTASQRVALAKGNIRELSALLSGVTAIKAALFFPSASTILLLAYLIPSWRQNFSVFTLLIPLVLAEVINPTWMCLGLERMQIMTVATVGFRGIATLLVFVLVRSPSDVGIAGLLSGLPILFASVFAIAYLWWREGIGLETDVRPLEFFNFARESAGAFLGILPSHVYARGSLIVLQAFVSPSALGSYAVAQKTSAMLLTLVSPLAQVLYPTVCRSAEGPFDRFSRLRKRIILGATVISIGAAGGLMVFSNMIVKLIAGETNNEAVVLLRGFGLIIVFTTLNVLLNMFVMALKRYSRMRTTYLIAAGMFLLLAPLTCAVFSSWGLISTLTVVQGWVLFSYLRITSKR